MPTVRLSAQARKDLAALLAAEGSPTACLMIHKVGSRADSKRTADGGTSWFIERSEAWAASVVNGHGLSSEEVTIIDGLRLWFAVLDVKNLPPLEVEVIDGQPHVRTAT